MKAVKFTKAETKLITELLTAIADPRGGAYALDGWRLYAEDAQAAGSALKKIERAQVRKKAKRAGGVL